MDVNEPVSVLGLGDDFLKLITLTIALNHFGSPYLAELFLVLGHFLQHLGQVPHGGL